MHKTFQKIISLTRYIFLSLLMVVLFFPFIFMIMNSFKSESGFHANKWVPNLRGFYPSNYFDAFDAIKFYLFNSVYLAILIALLVVALSSVTAYVFSVYEFPFKKFLYISIIIVMMMPGILTFIPTYVVVNRLGIYDTHLAVILPALAGGQIFTVFVLKSFFDQIPKDLIESAKIDGAKAWQIILKITLPLSLSMMTTMFVLSVLSQWNSYLWPLVTLSRKELWTIPIGIRFLAEQGNVRTTVQYAAYTIVSIPLIIMFMFTMDKFVTGLSSGAIKG